MLVGALPAQRIGWRHSVRDRRAVRRSKIRRLAYRLGLAENQCTGNLPVASDFLVPNADALAFPADVGNAAKGVGRQRLLYGSPVPFSFERSNPAPRIRRKNR